MAVATDKWRCNIADDSMSATVFITPPGEGESVAVEDVAVYLRANGVLSGFIYSEIEKMINEKTYYKDVVVAKGRSMIESQNGYYEFLFSIGEIKHPTIRSDGSVDYQSMSIIQSVSPGDVLAVYHPAVPGSSGLDVKNRELRCKPAKELPALKGTGFEVSFDGNTYKATMEGRVEYDNFKLHVRDLYELRKDLDLVTGRIDFRGDVVVHGNVRTGTYIRSTKSVTVDGSVEAATIIAEGDIVLKKGMQGGEKAKLVSGANIYANFIEFTEVKAKGNVETNIIFNSVVSAGKSILVKGKRGAIIGGTSYSVGQMAASHAGNKAEVRTVLASGISDDYDKRRHLLNSKAESARESIRKAKIELEQIRDVRLTNDPKEVKEAKISQLTRRLKRDERLLEHANKELAEIEETINVGTEAAVTIENIVNPGVTVRIDNKELKITSQMQNVKFFRPSGSSEIEVRQL
ncbi:MAG: FapA family protein [Lachnospiraceae bacterium]|nr:FapA family protein [Lachnospiraceae bacterium]